MTDYSKLTAGLTDLAKEVRQNSVDHGFGEHGDRLRGKLRDNSNSIGFAQAHEDYRAYLGNRLMLIVGEVAEAHEELRSGNDPRETHYTFNGHPVHRGVGDFAHLWESDDLFTDGGGVTGPEFSTTSPAKPEGLPSELADVLIRVLDTATELGIDIAGAVAEKMAYNASRPAMHGKKF